MQICKKLQKLQKMETNNPIFRSFALKRSSTRILGFMRTTTSLSKIKASPLSESDITMNLSKYLKQKRSKRSVCVRTVNAPKYFEF